MSLLYVIYGLKIVIFSNIKPKITFFKPKTHFFEYFYSKKYLFLEYYMYLRSR